jgi:hypothetical protein
MTSGIPLFAAALAMPLPRLAPRAAPAVPAPLTSEPET